MTLYVDSSALLKRYLDEADSAGFTEVLDADLVWVSAMHTLVEVRRNLVRQLIGPELVDGRAAFEAEWRRVDKVRLDHALCRDAVDLAELTGVRTLDALHLAAARRAGGTAAAFLTADLRQAVAARSLGMQVLGA